MCCDSWQIPREMEFAFEGRILFLLTLKEYMVNAWCEFGKSELHRLPELKVSWLHPLTQDCNV